MDERRDEEKEETKDATTTTTTTATTTRETPSPNKTFGKVPSNSPLWNLCDKHHKRESNRLRKKDETERKGKKKLTLDLAPVRCVFVAADYKEEELYERWISVSDVDFCFILF